MRNLTRLLNFFLIAICAFVYAQPETVKKHKGNPHFSLGEELIYKVTFGFLTVGKATTRVDQQYYPVEGESCYKIDAYGETSDWISWLTKVDDNWGAFLDTASISTQKSYRRIREGHYRLDEQTVFDHTAGVATVSVRDLKTGKFNSKKTFRIPPLATDLIGGFVHLRFIDFGLLKKGDSISIVGFLEDKQYHLRILYAGQQTIQTTLGRIPCHVLVPRMPDNKLFEGENSITVWISQDLNKIPVKILARMFIGSTGIELSGFRNLKNSLRVVP